MCLTMERISSFCCNFGNLNFGSKCADYVSSLNLCKLIRQEESATHLHESVIVASPKVIALHLWK
jgi:hypothetical protein